MLVVAGIAGVAAVLLLFCCCYAAVFACLFVRPLICSFARLFVCLTYHRNSSCVSVLNQSIAPLRTTPGAIDVVAVARYVGNGYAVDC